MGSDALNVAEGKPVPREMLDYFNRISHAREHGASIPAFSGMHYSLADLTFGDRPRDAKALSVHVRGAQQTYGLGYEETLAAAAAQAATADTPEALEWPMPFGSREKDTEGYTGHVPFADAMIGLTTAERVRLSGHRLINSNTFKPQRDLRHEPAAQPHAGFPYTAPPLHGLAAQRLQLVQGQQATAQRRAEELRSSIPVVTPRPTTAGPVAAANPRVRASEVSRYVFAEGDHGEALPPREEVRPAFVTALAPQGKVYGAGTPGKASSGAACGDAGALAAAAILRGSLQPQRPLAPPTEAQHAPWQPQQPPSQRAGFGGAQPSLDPARVGARATAVCSSSSVGTQAHQPVISQRAHTTAVHEAHAGMGAGGGSHTASNWQLQQQRLPPPQDRIPRPGQQQPAPAHPHQREPVLRHSPARTLGNAGTSAPHAAERVPAGKGPADGFAGFGDFGQQSARPQTAAPHSRPATVQRQQLSYAQAANGVVYRAAHPSRPAVQSGRPEAAAQQAAAHQAQQHGLQTQQQQKGHSFAGTKAWQSTPAVAPSAPPPAIQSGRLAGVSHY